MARERQSGLIGGSLEDRLKHARVPPIDHPLVLAPYRSDGHEEDVRAFATSAPLHIEIGFARAHHLLDLARLHPEAHILGFEIRRLWVKAASARAERQGLENVRVIEGDCRPLLERLIAPDSVDAYYALFPDPWWKKRHHKRRLFQPHTIARLHETLRPGGHLVVKTDVPAYADLIVELMTDSCGWQVAGVSEADTVLSSLPKSHREKKCGELDIPTFVFRFVKELHA